MNSSTKLSTASNKVFNYIPILLLLAFLFSGTGVNAQNISTVAGDGTSGYSDGSPAIAQKAGVTFRSVFYNGKLYYCDYWSHRVRVLDPVTNMLSTIVGTGTASSTGDGGPANLATLNLPSGIAIDNNGNMYITEQLGQRVRKINLATNVISTIAGTGVAGFSGNGGPATSATFRNPSGIAVDAAGNIYIADVANNQIRKINTSGIISRFIGNGDLANSGDGAAINAFTQIPGPYDIQFDSKGDLYFSTYGNVIRRVNMTTNFVYAYAGTYGANASGGDGGLATAARFAEPQSIAFDANDNLYIADQYNHRVRKINAATGIISTIAGTGTAGYFGDGGLATAARLNRPQGLAFDNNGGLFISDYANYRIRYVPVGMVLTKSVSPSSIVAGGTATYTFTINNAATGAINETGISFTDALPAGLRVAATPNAVITGGTGGTVTATAGGTSISLAGFSLNAGQSATITVNVTNAPGQFNASCASNPAAFTNNAANITAKSANLVNNVGNVCLVVDIYSCPPDPYAAQQTWWLTKGASKVRVDFQSGTALLNNPAAGFLGQGISDGSEGSVAVTHPITGELLFVTDGNRVYKGSTGAAASGLPVGGHPSAGESAAVIPDPQGVLGRDFIIFGNSSANKGGSNFSTLGGLFAGKYNLETNTITSVATLLAEGSIAEALEVIPQPNGTDYWILVAGADDVKVYAYTKASAFNTTPVSTVSVPRSPSLGSNANVSNYIYVYIGWDPRNPGKVVISRHHRIGLADFNPTTGALSTWAASVTNTASTQFYSGYSAALSPNGRYLYYTQSTITSANLRYYDFTTGTSTTLATYPSSALGIKIAKDGRLYYVSGNGTNSQLNYINTDANTPPSGTGSSLQFPTGGREVDLQLPNNVYWPCVTCQSGTAAPALASTTITPSPATVGDLIALLSASNTPAGTVISIHSGATATTANKLANNVAIVSGTTYYASFYDGLAVCYSPTTAVTVGNCTNNPTLGTPDGYTKVGISSLAGFANGWPGNVPNGFIAIESKNKGFVITRVANTDVITNPTEGMLIYDVSANCVKLYNGSSWNCIAKDCI